MEAEREGILWFWPGKGGCEKELLINNLWAQSQIQSHILAIKLSEKTAGEEVDSELILSVNGRIFD